MAANPTSPKVTSGAVSSALTTLVLGYVTPPELLALLGKYEILVIGAVAILAYAIAAYRKEDPLRTAGIAAQEAEKLIAQAQGSAPSPSAPASSAPDDVAQAVAAVEPFIPAALQKLAQAPATAPETPSV